MELNAYLFFAGNCREALDLYAKALGGTIEFTHLYSENPEICQQLPKEWQSKIMHAQLRAGNILLMASDVLEGTNGPCGTSKLVHEGSPITLSLNFSSEEQQAQVFNQLADGGKITMPLQDTFWGAKFGMLTDKFGIKWMLNCEKSKPNQAHK